MELNSQKLVDSLNQWNVVINPTFLPVYRSYSIRLSGDTLVNGLRYSKLHYSFDSLNTHWDQQIELLREDKFGKVFLLVPGTNEQVIYDFSLAAGETNQQGADGTLLVEWVDSIELNDKQIRRRLKLIILDRPNWGNVFWIEGIGSNLGLISSYKRFCTTDYAEELLCYFVSNTLLYPRNPRSCFITANRELPRGMNINFYPNPIVNKFDVHNPSGTSIYYKPFDPAGRNLTNGQLHAEDQSINMEALPPGIYYMYLHNPTGRIKIEKLVKLNH